MAKKNTRVVVGSGTPTPPNVKESSPVTEQTANDAVVEQPEPITVADAVSETPAENEIGGAPITTDTPVVDSVPTPVTPAAPVVVAEEVVDDIHAFIKKKYPALVGKLPPSITGIIEKLDDYVARMGVNVPVTEQDGGSHQLKLLNVFKTALGMPEGMHTIALEIVRWYFNKHETGAFSPRLAARFLTEQRFSKPNQLMFVALVNLFQLMANPTTARELNKHVNMDVVIRRIPSIDHQKRLMSFVMK